MPIQTIDFSKIPIQKPDYSGQENFFGNILQGYESGVQSKRAAEKAALEDKAMALANATEEKYGADTAAAKLALLQAQAEHHRKLAKGGSGGGSLSGSAVVPGGSPKERRILFNALGNDGKAEMYRIGGVLGWSPQKTQEEWIKGTDFENVAQEKGIDLGTSAGNYLATAANRTQLKTAESRGAELDYLEQETASDLSKYGPTFSGYSPAQIWEALQGKNEQEMINFLGARALQPEIASARLSVAGGSNAHEAIKDAKEAALANIKIPGFTITPKIREGVQRYINDKLRGGLKARKYALTHGTNEEESEGQMGEDPLGLSR